MTAPASDTDGALERLEQKLDQVLGLLSKTDEDLPIDKLPKEVELPF